MGIMHHSNYVVLYEQARTEWLRAMGLTYAEIEHRGVMSPIIGGGDVMGAVVLMSTDKTAAPSQTDIKLTQVAAGFLGKQMEE